MGRAVGDAARRFGDGLLGDLSRRGAGTGGRPRVNAAAPATAVIVLHWGVEADTLACLRSVVAAGFPARPLLAVDNGTGLPSDAAIAAVAPDAEVIRLPE